MSTKMTDGDWENALLVFRTSLPRRGAKGRDDRLFLEALHYFSVHNITWRALPKRFGKWNSVWKRFDRLSKAGVFEAFFDSLAGSVRRRIWCRCSIRPWFAPMSQRPAQKGAGKPGARPLAGWVLDENPSENRLRRISDRLRPDRWGEG